MAIESTQKAKLTLRAQDLALTTDVKNDYYLTVKLQKCLSMEDIAREVAALSTRQEDAEEVARVTRRAMQVMAWFLSSGYSISTPLGYFRPTASGVMLDSELTGAPDRSRITLGVSYSMGEEMRKALADTELDVEILKATTGPQISSVVSAQDAQHPEGVARGESVPIAAGENCIIKGKKLKVGGSDESVGVTIVRQDGDSQETFFFPPSKLYPNTPSQVGFVMPASAAEGSVWSVTLCTQLGASGEELKAPRTATMADFFVVGQTTVTPPGGDGGSEEDDGEGGSPL